MKFGKHAVITPGWGDIVLSKNKSFEYQLERKFATQPFEFSLSWTTKQDHAGISFTFSIYKLFWISLRIYDHRHWDCENGRWEV